MKAVERVPVMQQVVTNIKAYIQEGHVAIGDKLPTEKELCEMLSVGRGTIREAMRILQATGFVELRPGRGVFVANTKEPEKGDLVKWFADNEIELKDVLEVRMAIEPLAVKLAIERSKPTDLRVLCAIQEQSEQAAESGDAAALALCDERFHSAIVEFSRNNLLVTLNKQISASLKNFRGKTFCLSQNVQNFVPAHASIIGAFLQKNPVQGQQSMHAHLECVLDDLEQSKKYPDLEQSLDPCDTGTAGAIKSV